MPKGPRPRRPRWGYAHPGAPPRPGPGSLPARFPPEPEGMLSDLEPSRRKRFDPGYVAPPLWGVPGLTFKMPAAKMVASYPFSPNWLQRVADVPLEIRRPQFNLGPFNVPIPGAEATHDPRTGRIQVDPRRATPGMLLHEYGHALGPPAGFGEALTETLRDPGYPDPLAFYRAAIARQGPLGRLIHQARMRMPGRVARESYAEYPRLMLDKGFPIPEPLRRYYPWIDW